MPTTIHPTVLWRATRAYSLPASVVPVLLGTVLAFRGDGGSGQGHFDGTLFLVVLFGSILAHFGANVLNDYFDFIRGVDTRPEHGSGVLTGGHMTARETLVFGLVLLAGAAGCGLFVGVNRVAVVVPLALLGLGCAVLYPAFLKKYALGDLLILLFGPLLFVGAGVAVRLLPLWSLGSLLTFPLVLRAYRSGSVPGTAQTHLVFGLLYAASFLPAPVFI